MADSKVSGLTTATTPLANTDVPAVEQGGTLKQTTIKNILEAPVNAVPVIDGIKFPATQVTSANPNTLDDYEEGTFTPGITCDTPGDLSVTYNTRSGRYTKIGNIVCYAIRIVPSAFTYTTASGNVIIDGLPFLSSPVVGNRAVQTIIMSRWTAPTDFSAMTPVITNTTQEIDILRQPNNGDAFSTVVISEFVTGNIPTLLITGHYEV